MKFRPALIIAGAAVFLLAAAYLPFAARSGGAWTVKRIDFLSALRARMPGPTIVSEKIARAFRQARSIPAAKSPAVIPVIPDAAAAAVQALEFVDDGSLDGFFGALHSVRRDGKPVRIAYYGDSIAEGDLITQDLRAHFQKTFGGGGTGFLPIASEVAPFRITIVHDFSLDWKTVSILQRRRPVPVGIAGEVFLPACSQDGGAAPICSAWVEYSVPTRWPSLKEIAALRVFYADAEAPAAVECAADDAPPVFFDLEPGEGVHQTVIIPAVPAKKIRLTFRGRNAFPIYGASWDVDGGVQVDNFALRSNTGLPLTEIPLDILRQFDEILGYRLIILHFGTNVTSPDQPDYSWYRAGMVKVVRHFRQAFPKASILLIGAADRSYKADAEYVTIPTVPVLVETQRRTAEDAGAAFWDLYEAMGGLNSMVAWVGHKPPLAALDYTHLSSAGSRRVAEFLYNALLSRFRIYEENRAR